jgi:hypothetical protein
LHTLLNDLGREGWKLVASDIANSAIFTGVQGYQEAAAPIRQRWTLIREVGS